MNDTVKEWLGKAQKDYDTARRELAAQEEIAFVIEGLKETKSTGGTPMYLSFKRLPKIRKSC
jgi:hypothetical protein